MAGFPRADERGAITSHRARATLAILLYNAPDGLALCELMHWLRHINPASTQRYVMVKPTKLAASYSKTEHNSRLVDTTAEAKDKVKNYYVLGEHGFCGNAARPLVCIAWYASNVHFSFPEIGRSSCSRVKRANDVWKSLD